MTLKLLRYTASGNVQGVFFREGAKSEAERLTVSGWVKNMSDGTVQGEAIGESSNITKCKCIVQHRLMKSSRSDFALEWQVTEWLRKGPEHAEVTDLQTDVEEVEDDKYKGVFEKRKGH